MFHLTKCNICYPSLKCDDIWQLFAISANVCAALSSLQWGCQPLHWQISMSTKSALATFATKKTGLFCTQSSPTTESLRNNCEIRTLLAQSLQQHCCLNNAAFRPDYFMSEVLRSFYLHNWDVFNSLKNLLMLSAINECVDNIRPNIDLVDSFNAPLFASSFNLQCFQRRRFRSPSKPLTLQYLLFLRLMLKFKFKLFGPNSLYCGLPDGLLFPMPI